MVRMTSYKDILEAMNVEMNCKEGRNELEGKVRGKNNWIQANSPDDK